MADINEHPEAPYLRELARAVNTTFGEWFILMHIEGMIKLSTESGGKLSQDKHKFKLQDFILAIYKEYYTHLKPVGGSFAGAVRDRPGVNTRADDGLELDPTGEANLTRVLDTIADEKNLSDNDVQELHRAARFFKIIIIEALDNKVVGLRANTGKFESFHPSGMLDAYKILDEMLSELRPLEILMMGPCIALTLEYTHCTRVAPNVRTDEIRSWDDTLLASFRSSTPEDTMSWERLLDRRSALQQLVYLTSKDFEGRVKNTRSTNFHSVQNRVLPIIHEVVTEPELTSSAIADLMRPILQTCPGANIKTRVPPIPGPPTRPPPRANAVNNNNGRKGNGGHNNPRGDEKDGDNHQRRGVQQNSGRTMYPDNQGQASGSGSKAKSQNNRRARANAARTNNGDNKGKQVQWGQDTWEK